MTYTLQELRDKDMIIFEAIMGSRAYGTSLPTSDTDIRGIFIQPLDDILKHGYVDQVSDLKNDIVFYELKRFMDLVKTNNPNILELLNAPEDCILKETPSYSYLVGHRGKFISKMCRKTFGGYAIAQIKKARGLRKKMNWDEKEMVRKTVLDFCYVLLNGRSIPFKEWKIVDGGDRSLDLKQEELGLAKINHARDLYAMYNLSLYEGKRGIIKNEETSNDVQVVSFPKGSSFIANLSFNKDGYSTHCKLYNEYQTWLENRNEDRFKMNKSHGKNYDSKNMMHTFRLLNMAVEIATEHKIKVRRSEEEIDELMKIRRGEMEYENLLDDAEDLMVEMDQYFEDSSLQKEPDLKLIEDLQYNTRRSFYKITGQL